MKNILFPKLKPSSQLFEFIIHSFKFSDPSNDIYVINVCICDHIYIKASGIYPTCFDRSQDTLSLSEWASANIRAHASRNFFFATLQSLFINDPLSKSHRRPFDYCAAQKKLKSLTSHFTLRLRVQANRVPPSDSRRHRTRDPKKNPIRLRKDSRELGESDLFLHSS